MILQPRDIVEYQGISYQVEGVLEYRLGARPLRLARLVSGNGARFLELAGRQLGDRAVLLCEIAALDITTPPPATIYHGGESFLLRLSGTANVTILGDLPGRAAGTCMLWRYRAAGERFLQIESWPDGVRMLEGASVHRSMIEIRPATFGTP